MGGGTRDVLPKEEEGLQVWRWLLAAPLPNDDDADDADAAGVGDDDDVDGDDTSDDDDFCVEEARGNQFGW